MLGGLELLLHLPFGVNAVEFEAVALQGQALDLVVRAAELGEVGAELAQVMPAGDWIQVFGGEELGCSGGVLEGEPAGEFFGEVFGEGWVAQGVFVVEVADEGEGVLVDEPVAVTADFPMVEVGGRDGGGVELGGEEGLDFGEGVEPGEDGRAAFVVEEALVELVADGGG